ncbi:MAG: 16S rRNA (guanine(966)-N(2))-methyltransferase RsmD [Verrucomicrobia bacterium]|nr:16S rRNA (guanine(966)-N(2))-methyltransferase RsmD [Verrucomicrobiota bacterium]
MAHLQILSGKLKGRSLQSPRGEQTRPTTAILRKSVFDTLRPYLEGAHFLDLFAGSGAMGIEALSNGAAHATFVENHPLALKALRHNLQTLELEKHSTVLAMDAETALKKMHAPFDVIYSDPPYESTFHTLLLPFLGTHSLLRPEGFLFLEEGKETPYQSLPHLQFVRTRNFGDSYLHHFRAAPKI